MSTILLHLLKRIPLQVPSDTTTINTAAIREHIKNADKANKQGKEKPFLYESSSLPSKLRLWRHAAAKANPPLVFRL